MLYVIHAQTTTMVKIVQLVLLADPMVLAIKD